ncbi:MAG: carboxypeptidase regulatory-like domain-containing protein [bacterium]|nr:carboxypeptidase regulatory-like domain-containing protein [bacterium]
MIYFQTHKRPLQLTVLGLTLMVILVVVARMQRSGDEKALMRDANRGAEDKAELQATDNRSDNNLPNPGEGLRTAIAAPVAGVEQTADPGPEALTGIVLDAKDKPIAGAVVEAFSAPNASFNTFDLEFEPPTSVQARDTTGAPGRFRLDVPDYHPFDVVASAEGFASMRVEACYAGQEITIRLGLGCELHGLITSEQEGLPVPNVRLRIFNNGATGTLESSTDANGAYRIAGLPAGEAWLQVIPPAHAMPSLFEVKLNPLQATRQDVVLKAGRTITGEVRDARTGRGIAGAEVSSWSFLGKTVRTDLHGQFRLEGVRVLKSSVMARAKGYGRAEEALHARADVVNFELEPARCIAGHVVDPEGRPLDRALVSICGTSHDGGVQQLEWRTAISDAEGYFLIDGLRKDLGLLLFVRLEGWGSATRVLPQFDARYDPLVLEDLTLHPHAILAGRVLDARGCPAPGKNLTLRGPEGSAGIDSDISTYSHLRSTQSDERGRFSIADLAEGNYELSVASHESCPESIAVSLEASEARTDFEWVLTATGSVKGRVSGSDGVPLPEVSIALFARSGPRRLTLSTRTDERGEFDLSTVCAGDYSLRAVASSAHGRAHSLASLVVHGIELDGPVLELRLLEADSEIRGRVVDSEGAGIALALVSIDHGIGALGSGVLTDATGEFVLEVPAGSKSNLRAWRTRELDTSEGSTHALEMQLGRRIVGREDPPARLDDVASGSQNVEMDLGL